MNPTAGSCVTIIFCLPLTLDKGTSCAGLWVHHLSSQRSRALRLISRASRRSCNTSRVARLKAPGWSLEVRLVLRGLGVVVHAASTTIDGQQQQTPAEQHQLG